MTTKEIKNLDDKTIKNLDDKTIKNVIKLHNDNKIIADDEMIILFKNELKNRGIEKEKYSLNEIQGMIKGAKTKTEFDKGWILLANHTGGDE